MHRRSFILYVFVFGSCKQLPTQPTEATTSLLSRVRQLGYTNARAVRYSGGGSQIYINDHPNWNFLLDGQLLKIGQKNQYTEDIPNIQIPDSKTPTVR